MKKKRKLQKKLCRRKKREMWNKKIGEIKDANIKKNLRKFYKEAKEMNKEYQQQNVIYIDEKGKILTEEKDILGKDFHSSYIVRVVYLLS